jgi:hypothetical protein
MNIAVIGHLDFSQTLSSIVWPLYKNNRVYFLGEENGVRIRSVMAHLWTFAVYIVYKNKPDNLDYWSNFDHVILDYYYCVDHQFVFSFYSKDPRIHIVKGTLILPLIIAQISQQKESQMFTPANPPPTQLTLDDVLWIEEHSEEIDKEEEDQNETVAEA